MHAFAAWILTPPEEYHTEVASLNLSRSMVELSWNMAKDWKWNVFQYFIPFPAGDWSGASSSDMPAQSSLISLKTCSVSTRHFVHSKSFKIWLLNLRLFKHSVLLLAPQQPPWLHRHLGCKTTSEASAYRRLALALAFDAVVLFCPGIRHNRSRKMWRLESSGYEGKKRRICGRRPGRWDAPSDTPGLAPDKDDQKWHGCRKDTNLNPMANCIMEYDVPVVVQCLLKCCLLFHSGSQKILGGQPHAQRWDRWNWLQSEAQTSNGSAVESDTTERCFVQVRMWRILQRPWWSGPQLHSPLGIYRWGRINDLSYLLHQVSSHFLCHICRIHLHFFAGPNRCMCCMLQVMLIETNIDINAMMCWCKVWEQILSKISILTF